MKKVELQKYLKGGEALPNPPLLRARFKILKGNVLANRVRMAQSVFQDDKPKGYFFFSFIML